MELLCLVVAVVAAGLAWAGTPLARAAARRTGFVDHPGPRKIHDTPMPYGGGWAVAGATIVALAAGGWAWRQFLENPAWAPWRDGLGLSLYIRQVQLASHPPMLKLLLVCLGGACGALVLGVVDDRRPLTPPAKLVVQFALAIAAVAGGVRLTMLIGDNLFTQALTVLWIVLITNSFNLLDNMDGLCGGTAAIAAGLLSWFAAATGQSAVALCLAALAGACVGFLRHNLWPASVFLGDAGSMFIGFLIATLSVVTTYYHYHESVLSVAVPLLVLAIPLYDTFSVVTIRFLSGRSLLTGDKSHFSHRLIEWGMSQRRAVATIHLAALAIGLPALVLPHLPLALGLLLVCQALLILGLIATLEHAARQEKKPDA